MDLLLATNAPVGFRRLAALLSAAACFAWAAFLFKVFTGLPLTHLFDLSFPAWMAITSGFGVVGIAPLFLTGFYFYLPVLGKGRKWEWVMFGSLSGILVMLFLLPSSTPLTAVVGLTVYFFSAILPIYAVKVIYWLWLGFRGKS